MKASRVTFLLRDVSYDLFDLIIAFANERLFRENPELLGGTAVNRPI
eukprot:TCALIF_12645-PA protein Name:"Protein of unknown function" AED:0.43 eAED:0.43 QI:0/0/0/0.5/0/0.5/2/0/46